MSREGHNFVLQKVFVNGNEQQPDHRTCEGVLGINRYFKRVFASICGGGGGGGGGEGGGVSKSGGGGLGFICFFI